jgi:hypothetical protein
LPISRERNINIITTIASLSLSRLVDSFSLPMSGEKSYRCGFLTELIATRQQEEEEEELQRWDSILVRQSKTWTQKLGRRIRVGAMAEDLFQKSCLVVCCPR